MVVYWMPVARSAANNNRGPIGPLLGKKSSCKKANPTTPHTMIRGFLTPARILKKHREAAGKHNICTYASSFSSGLNTFDGRAVEARREASGIHGDDEGPAAVQQLQVRRTLDPVPVTRKPQPHLEIRLFCTANGKNDGKRETTANDHRHVTRTCVVKLETAPLPCGKGTSKQRQTHSRSPEKVAEYSKIFPAGR